VAGPSSSNVSPCAKVMAVPPLLAKVATIAPAATVIVPTLLKVPGAPPPPSDVDRRAGGRVDVPRPCEVWPRYVPKLAGS
jgi:hypothetical protein